MSVYQKLNLCLKLARTYRNLSSIQKNTGNHYEVLGIKLTASQDEIKNSYFEKTKLYHPDIAGTTDANLKKFRQIAEAYEVLGNPAARKEYDEKVLGIANDDRDAKDISDYRNRMLQRRVEETSEWTKNYANKMREDEYRSKTSVKSSNDFYFVPTQKVKPSIYENVDNHRITKLLSSIIVIIIIIISQTSEGFIDS